MPLRSSEPFLPRVVDEGELVGAVLECWSLTVGRARGEGCPRATVAPRAPRQRHLQPQLVRHAGPHDSTERGHVATTR